MTKRDWRILIVDDHDAMRDGLELLMRRRGHKTMAAEDGQQGLQLLEEQGADLVITDLKMGKLSGIDVLMQSKQLAPETDVLVITAHGTVEKAVEAMKRGACDFITKPFSSEEFGIKVDRILRERSERLRLLRENVALRVENTYLRSEASDSAELYGEMVGKSAGMKTVRRFVDQVAATDSTVMVYGESGTGKELVARALHARSHRRDGPFVRVNCGALPEGLLESELFGHEKGAFTGADRQRRGRFELADGGTLFLDEISTVSASTQVRLLRVLQERELERVGGEKTISVDVRIVAATNTPADELRLGKDFRQDLFYRLHVVPVTLPPLRERRDDVPLLVEHFVGKLRARTRSAVKAVEPGAMDRMRKYRWPGNIRELENVVERALVLADGELLREAHLPFLPERDDSGGKAGEVAAPSLPAHGGLELNRVLERIEEDLVRKALDQAGGVKAAAARLLSIKKSALHYKINKYGIEA